MSLIVRNKILLFIYLKKEKTHISPCRNQKPVDSAEGSAGRSWQKESAASRCEEIWRWLSGWRLRIGVLKFDGAVGRRLSNK